MFKFGVDTFIWTEDFTENNLWIIDKAKEIGFSFMDFAISHPEKFPIEKVKAKLQSTGITPVITTTLARSTNLISSDKYVREAGILHMKLLVDICASIGAKILGGVNYAAWGYITGKCRTESEWQYSVNAMKEICAYAKEIDPEIIIAVECCETRFLRATCSEI